MFGHRVICLQGGDFFFVSDRPRGGGGDDWLYQVATDTEATLDVVDTFRWVNSGDFDHEWLRWHPAEFSFHVGVLVGRGLVAEDRNATRGLQGGFFHVYNGETREGGGRVQGHSTTTFLRGLLSVLATLHQQFFFVVALVFSRNSVGRAREIRTRVSQALRDLRDSLYDAAVLYVAARRFDCPCQTTGLISLAQARQVCSLDRRTCPLCGELGGRSPLRHVVVCTGGVVFSHGAAHEYFVGGR